MSPAIAACAHFLAVVERQSPAASYAEVLEALDRLLFVYHATPNGYPADEEMEPPTEDYQTLFRRLGAQFPDLGFYPTILTFDEPVTQTGVGCAIDDLVDLTLFTREVVFRADRFELNDAHWYFRLQYFDWGHHARGLAALLHELVTA